MSLLILTQYHGPTNTRGSRISAKLRVGASWARCSLPYDHAIDSEANHRQAAIELCSRRGLVLKPDAAMGPASGYAFFAA